MRFMGDHLYGIKGKEIEGSSSGEKRKGSEHRPIQENEKKFKGNNGRGDIWNQGGKAHMNLGSKTQPIGERPKRVFHCKRCNKNHPGKDCDGKPVTCRPKAGSS